MMFMVGVGGKVGDLIFLLTPLWSRGARAGSTCLLEAGTTLYGTRGTTGPTDHIRGNG